MINLDRNTAAHTLRTAETLTAIAECLVALERGTSAIFKLEGVATILDDDRKIIAFLSRFTADNGMSFSVFAPLVAGEVTYQRRIQEAEMERREVWDAAGPQAFTVMASEDARAAVQGRDSDCATFPPESARDRYTARTELVDASIMRDMAEEARDILRNEA